MEARGMKRWIALAIALLLAATAFAEGAVRELSAYYGKDIAEAAEAIGGLTYAEGKEFKDNYTSDALALRGDGSVVCIELREASKGDALCGVSVGMARKDVVSLMEGYPMPWEYDEEIAWIVRADENDELNSETLVVFFDEDGRVNGAWYRTSEA
jgi:hypothetical protein